MSSSPTKLTLNEIWDVYLLIGDNVSNPIQEKLIDETISILRKSSRSIILKSIKIFGYKVTEDITPINVALYVTSGIKTNHFLDFVRQIRML